MSWFILICYIMFAYGISYIFTNSYGPKNIFFKLREWAEDIGPNFGLLFRCMICFPTNLGIIFSLFNWFLLPIAISPFNMIFHDYSNCWYIGILAALMDGCLTGGVCKIIYNVDDFIDKSTPIFEDEVEKYGYEPD